MSDQDITKPEEESEESEEVAPSFGSGMSFQDGSVKTRAAGGIGIMNFQHQGFSRPQNQSFQARAKSMAKNTTQPQNEIKPIPPPSRVPQGGGGGGGGDKNTFEKNYKEPIFNIITTASTEIKVEVESEENFIKSKIKFDDNFIECDGNSPLFTYSSSTHQPNDISIIIKNILTNKVKHDQNIDFHQITSSIFDGRGYYHEQSGRLEFRIIVCKPGRHSLKSTLSEVEIRKMNGDAYSFQQLENDIIKLLLIEKSIDTYQVGALGDISYLIEEDNDENNDGFVAGFRLQSLPFIPDDEQEQEKEKDLNNYQITSIQANEFITNACDKNQCNQYYEVAVEDFRNALFNEDISEESLNHFKNSQDGVFKLVESIENCCYNSWIICTILECINKLIQIGSQKPNNFNQSIENIKEKWSKNVIIQIGAFKMKFFKSQQIENRCKTILSQ